MFRFLLACVISMLFALSLSTKAFAETLETSFYSQGKRQTLHVEKDHVAIAAQNAPKDVDSPVLSLREETLLEQMDVQVIARPKVEPKHKIRGYPVWFDRDNDAVGILTHETVLRVKPGTKVKNLLKKEDGYADHYRARFGQGIYLVQWKSPMKALTAANRLYDKTDVLYTHPNFLIPKTWRGSRKAAKAIDEPLFQAQWHLENTGQFEGTPGADVSIREAWSITQGSDEVLVAVLDGGFETSHPDLENAWHTNPDEIPGNGLDDDENGYVDDVTGWNFDSDSNDPSDADIDDHGTAVAGLVGARQNGEGLIGSCPKCRMLPIVVSWETAKDAAAFHYAAEAGADIITNSWGYPVGTPHTDVVVDAINESAAKGRDGKGAIILFAMNNIDQNDCTGDKPDISSLDSVIAVSASSDLDKKVSFSAWGECMEFLSPSYEMDRPGIATTDLTGEDGYNTGRRDGNFDDLAYTNDFGGTSAATPTAAGIFGLILSINPDLSRDEALTLVLSTADKVHPDLADYDPETGFSRKYGYGRINASAAVRAAKVFRKYTLKSKKLKNTKKL